MPDAVKSNRSIIYNMLFFAGKDHAFMEESRDPREETFGHLVTLLDQALLGDVALYATHSFADPFVDINAPLTGRVVVLTRTLIASVDVRSGLRMSVDLVPLRTITSVTVVLGGESTFVGHPSWGGFGVQAKVSGGSTSTVLSLPAVRSSGRNATEFAGFYPKLIEALRTP
ncbi:hypothetical protein [Clavibacter sp. VKM Ac-2872]|uniref:hypothetical protein n=1 Tax=Clavibacter sp. VKM Ac-2872 TaxID=2783812 RepID=UPI00188C515E|nr:hypothetical protein [Clavibacter sp. VKM Ac-2872]MBF4625887.1 hypothetical protein [Clavibacter sp. VKM Ac-2872]